MKQLKLILIGGGARCNAYMRYVDKHPERFKLVGIAEPVEDRRIYFMDKYGIPKENCYESYADILSLPKFADIAMICTQDQLHYEPALMAIEKKYNLLLEKPISNSAEECFEIYSAAQKNNIKAVVCHVLRYTPFYKKLKSLLSDGIIGDITNIHHTESVGNVHMSHSYVRGNWRKLSESAPMILAKCCHDTDLLQWLIGSYCKRVQSFGALAHFCEKNAPENSPERCLDGCPHKDTCFYYAPRIYNLGTPETDHFKTVVAQSYNPTEQEVYEALKTSQYGRCVYHCDNDVVDRQTVNMEFGNNICATLTMSAFNKGGRTTSIMGSKGELHADLENQTIEFYSFETGKTTELYEASKEFLEGHGGGDDGLMEDLYEYVANDMPSSSISDMETSCLSHLIAFASEKSRVEGTVIDMEEYFKSFHK